MSLKRRVSNLEGRAGPTGTITLGDDWPEPCRGMQVPAGFVRDLMTRIDGSRVRPASERRPENGGIN